MRFSSFLHPDSEQVSFLALSKIYFFAVIQGTTHGRIQLLPLFQLLNLPIRRIIHQAH